MPSLGEQVDDHKILAAVDQMKCLPYNLNARQTFRLVNGRQHLVIINLSYEGGNMPGPMKRVNRLTCSLLLKKILFGQRYRVCTRMVPVPTCKGGSNRVTPLAILA